MKISKRQLRRIIKEEIALISESSTTGKETSSTDWKDTQGHFAKKDKYTWGREWKDRSREGSTDKDFSAVKSWLSSNGFGESEVFDGADRAWQNEANDEDFVILRQFITATDFDWDKMNNSAKEEINVAFIKSVGNNTKPVYAYVRY